MRCGRAAGACTCESLDLLGFLAAYRAGRDVRDGSPAARDDEEAANNVWTAGPAFGPGTEPDGEGWTMATAAAEEDADQDWMATPPPPSYLAPAYAPPTYAHATYPAATYPAATYPAATYPHATYPPRTQPPGPAHPPGRVPARRRSLTVMVSAIAGAVALATGGALFWLNRPTTPLITRVTAAEAVRTSLTAASRAGSVHVAETDTGGGSPNTHETIDSTTSWGVVTAHLPQGQMSIMVNGPSMYIQGDKYGLAQFGFSARTATTYSSKWMSLPSVSAEMSQTAQQLRSTTLINDLLALNGPITRVGKVANRQLTVTGRIPSNRYTSGQGAGDVATLVLSTKSPYYPLSLRYSDPQNGTTSMVFQKWGQVQPWVPRHTVPTPAGTPATG